MTDYNLILPRELPDAATASTNGAIPLDDGSAVVKVTPKKIVDAGRPFATQAQAEAGTDATVAMSPLTTKQAIEAVVPAVVLPYVELAEAWAESPTPPDPGIPDSKSAKTWADEARAAEAGAEGFAQDANDAADRAEIVGPAFYPEVSDFLSASALPALPTFNSKDGGAWELWGSASDVVVDGKNFRVVTQADRVFPVSLFGAVGNAYYFNPADKKWYVDSLYATEATDDTAAINKAVEAARVRGGGTVLLTGQHLVNGTILMKGDNCITFASPATASPTSHRSAPCLCAGHGVTSILQADNTWTNAVIRIDCSDNVSSNIQLKNIAVLGHPYMSASLGNRANRCGIQGYFWNKGYSDSVYVQGFERPGVSLTGLCQDHVFTNWEIMLCGKNIAGGAADRSDPDYWCAAYEHRPNTVTVQSWAPGRAPNALRWIGLRLEICPAFIMFDHGVRNVGEINFFGLKMEVGSWQTPYDMMTWIRSGVGTLNVIGGHQFSHVTPANGAPIFDIQNYNTRLDALAFIGDAYHLRSRGRWFEGRFTVDQVSCDRLAVNILRGDVDIFAHQYVGGKSARNFMRIGQAGVSNPEGGGKVVLKVRNIDEFDTDITSGRLIETPTADQPIEPLDIELYLLDHSLNGHHNYGQLYRGSGATTSNMVQYISRAEVNARPRVYTSDPEPNGTYRVISSGDRFVVDYVGGTVERVTSAPIGTVVTIIAGTNSFTLKNGPNLITKTGADVLVASGDSVSLMCQANGKAVQL